MPKNNCEQCIKKINEINANTAKIIAHNKRLEKRIDLYEEVLQQKNELINQYIERIKFLEGRIPRNAQKKE